MAESARASWRAFARRTPEILRRTSDFPLRHGTTCEPFADVRMGRNGVGSPVGGTGHSNIRREEGMRRTKHVTSNASRAALGALAPTKL
jgi:hypothetical protein